MEAEKICRNCIWFEYHPNAIASGDCTHESLTYRYRPEKLYDDSCGLFKEQKD